MSKLTEVEQLVGLKIEGFVYGPDADGDPQIYFIRLENGVRIGIAHVSQDGEVKPADREKRYDDGTILRFMFYNLKVQN